MDAHHIFSQAKRFKSQWNRVNLNIHDPNNLMWWQKNLHRKNAKGYNKAWDSFFEGRPEATLKQIQEFGNSLMKSYGH